MKTVLITGSSSGIGRDLAREFHRQGFRVIAVSRNTGPLKHIKKENFIVKMADINIEKERKSLISWCETYFNGVDILVNNAGYGQMGPLADLDTSALLKQFQINLFAPLDLSRLVLPSMRARGGGVIVNMGSSSAEFTTPLAGAYCASKAALHRATDALRMELKPMNIQVVKVIPGTISSSFGNVARIHAEKILSPESHYLTIRDYIVERAEISQKRTTPSEVFARNLVQKLMKKRIKKEIRMGKGAWVAMILPRLIPRAIKDRILCNRFGLVPGNFIYMG